MIKIYGTRDSRAFRCLWALEESGLAYELIPVDWRTRETRTPEFLALNPNGHVPVFEQDGLVLVESLAINLHISQLAPDALSAAGSVDQSHIIQWTIWAMGELEGPHDAANRGETDVDDELRQRALGVLDQHLEQSPYLVSEAFTVADLNVASVLMRPKYMPYVSNHKHVDAWFKRSATRPALAKALGR
ncbi:MAG: glutathione S-transferase family protein [Henriciella sp.]|nr:glutathione S-transferase family protein [Henriciella sp.]